MLVLERMMLTWRYDLRVVRWYKLGVSGWRWRWKAGCWMMRVVVTDALWGSVLVSDVGGGVGEDHVDVRI